MITAEPQPLFTITPQRGGALEAYSFTMSRIVKLTNIKGAETLPTADFIREFLQVVTKNPDGQAPPKDDLASLTADELEDFASKYIEARPSLCQGKDGALIPRYDAESAQDYLARLIKLQIAQLNDTAAKLRKNSGLLSDKLIKSLGDASLANTALVQSISRVQSSATDRDILVSTIPPNHTHITNRKLGEISTQLGAMKDMAIKSASTVSAVSESVAQFVEDFAVASASSNRAAKTASWLALISILAAVAQIFYSVYSANQQEPETQAAISQITQKIETVGGIIKERDTLNHQDSEQLRKAIDELAKSVRNLAAEQEVAAKRK